MRLLMGLICLLMAASVVAAQEGIQEGTVEAIIASQPDDVAISCESGDSQFSHNADERFPLASTFKVFVLAEFARQFDAGEIDPDATLTLDEVNAYWLPGTDGAAHDQFLEYLGDDREEITLRELAVGMIRFSSNAATDALMAQLGYEGYDVLYEMLGIEDSDRPTRFMVGDFLLIDNHETGAVDLSTLDAETLAAESARLADLFVNDAEWRAAELVYAEERQGVYAQAAAEEDYTMMTQIYDTQAAFGTEFGFMGTASDVLRTLAAAHEEGVFSEEARVLMQEPLNWLFEVNPANSEVYTALATKGGSWSGILTGAWYVQPKDGDRTLLAVFYRNLPIEVWGEWASTGAHQELELRVFAFGEGCDVFEVAAES